jgi:hypothetical protein
MHNYKLNTSDASAYLMPLIMKPRIARSFVASLCCALVACVNPYLAQMDQLDADYQSGRISRTEYNRRLESLNARSDAWAAQNSANAALGVAAIGAAAEVGGALIQAEATEDLAHAVGSRNRGGGAPAKKGGGAPSKKGGTKKKPQGGGGGGSQAAPSAPSGGGAAPTQPSAPSKPSGPPAQ